MANVRHFERLRGPPLLLACLLLLPFTPAFAELTIGEFVLVSSPRVSRVASNFTYQLEVNNSGPEIQNVSVILTSNSPNTVIVDGELTFATVPANTSFTSTDTFTFRQDRRFPFNPSDLVFEFRGTVPDVAGLSRADAEAALVAAGFVVGSIATTDDDTVPAGSVISQTAVAGTTLPLGALVDLEIAQGASDTTPPAVSILTPIDRRILNTTPITVTGTVDDETANVDVNGVAATVAGGDFTATGVPLREGDNQIVATATDPANNSDSSGITVILDTVPPTIGISSPAADSTVNENSPLIEVTYGDVGAGLDLNSLSTVAGPGVIIGEVFDDTRSLPLEGAMVEALKLDTGAVLATTVSDDRGRYLLTPGDTQVLIRATKAGFTTAERTIASSQGTFADVLDARLTPLGGPEAVAAAFGGEIATTLGVTLIIPPGALGSDNEVGLTDVSGQGPRSPPGARTAAVVIGLWVKR